MVKVMNFEDIKGYVTQNNSQSHLCICNTELINGSIENGIYGFPHQGSNMKKSFWRAVASMYNIGPYDLVFFYRTNGKIEGCKEIHGPFKIKTINDSPTIYYDPSSSEYPMNIPDSNADCKVRFLFEKFDDNNSCKSLSDNFELIKKYEAKEIWGYRHPSVMNIGAARKKSVTSFTAKQTLLLLDLINDFGKDRYEIETTIPLVKHIDYYSSGNKDRKYNLDDKFLLSSTTMDEAYLYAYIMCGFKNHNSNISYPLIKDFTKINTEILPITFQQISVNVMMEVIVSPNLQDELDIVLMDKDDSYILFLEIKSGIIDQSSINQTARYIDLLSAIFPNRKVYANVIGSEKQTNTIIPSTIHDRLCTVQYKRNTNGTISFNKIT